MYVFLRCRFTAWFLFKLFGRLLSSIQIHNGQMDILREASQVSWLSFVWVTAIMVYICLSRKKWNLSISSKFWCTVNTPSCLELKSLSHFFSVKICHILLKAAETFATFSFKQMKEVTRIALSVIWASLINCR